MEAENEGVSAVVQEITGLSADMAYLVTAAAGFTIILIGALLASKTFAKLLHDPKY